MPSSRPDRRPKKLAEGARERKLSQLSLLGDLAVEVSTLDSQLVVARALEWTLHILRADNGVIYEAKEGALVPLAHRGLCEESQRRLAVVHSRSGPAGRAFALQAPVRVDSPEASAPQARWFIELEGVSTSAAAPLLVRGEATGALVVSRRAPEPFTSAELRLLSGIGAQLGVALENARLYTDLRESYSALARAQAELVRSERLTALGELAAQVAHEVRNPLGAIANATCFLKREGARRDLVDIIGEECDRLSGLVNDLLDFARPTPHELQLLPLAPLLEEVLAAGVAARARPKIRVERSLCDVRVAMDARLLRQALLNLVTNAVQAMPQGGTLSLQCVQDGPKVRVSVADTGVGIPRELHARIFEPFFTSKPTGTGLGLAVVARILELHGGSIALESAAGHGATFTVELPVAIRAAG